MNFRRKRVRRESVASPDATALSRERALGELMPHRPMAALFPISLSSCNRKRAAVEDLDLQITETLEGQREAARAARGSLLRGTAGKTNHDGHALHRRKDEPRSIGRYALVRPLGRGGMGIVYEARDERGEPIALKTLERRSSGAEEALRREVRALKRLDHPGVVRLRTEVTRRRDPFFTMDLLPGPSLAAVLGRGSRDLLAIVRCIASSLAFVHAEGIVHGDLTPSNILFRAPDQPVLVDFGLSVSALENEPRCERDVRGRIVGTLAYMAPERIRRQRVDARADLYALGCILYEALTGRVPFNGNHRATVLRQHLEAAPCPPSVRSPSVPGALERLCLRLLAKLPQERTQCAGEVVAVLDSLESSV